MKKAYLLLFAITVFWVAGCGTPDPILKSPASKNQSQVGYKDDNENEPTATNTNTHWKRIGTHEVEQRPQ